jgi:Lantibiotic biosynthesis dehydratase C-term
MADVAEWMEVSIVPAPEARETLLLDVVDPLVHEQLADVIDTWFYFWEPELRLRLRWREPRGADDNRAALARILDSAQADGKLDDWYEGSHGSRGETYRGEADLYGAEVWELVAQDWMSGSELALAITRAEAEGALTRPPSFHWQRRVHLFSNQLSLDEVPLCLLQARGYLDMRGATDRRAKDVMRAIERFLAAEDAGG